MLRDVAMSGVVMTRTHALGAPYYVVNFDDATARTDTVTGGGDARTVVCLPRRRRCAPTSRPRSRRCCSAVQNIEKLVGHDSLDIEFAVTRRRRVHILQVRPIAVHASARSPIDDDADRAARSATPGAVRRRARGAVADAARRARRATA